MSNTDKDWEFWGKNNAHFGVLTDNKFMAENADENLNLFFMTGEKYISSRIKTLDSLLGKINRHRALDFGCGVGRLTEPLAIRFDEVIGLDISPSMLAKARENAAAHDLVNITYAQSDDLLTNANGMFDFVHTYIVLQHIPTKRGMNILRGLLDRVTHGGVASLHVCVRREHSPMANAIDNIRRYVPPVHSMINLIRGRNWREPIMQMNEYSLLDVISVFHTVGIENVIVDTERHGNFLTAHIAGRKVTT